MVIVLGLKFVPIECINCLVYYCLAFFYFLICLINDIRITFDLLLQKFNHQHPILTRFPIEEYDTVGIDSLVENNVLDLSSAFTVEIS